MANKTIPQLPEQTGKTNDDLLVIVDSGETTTSKIKVSTLLDGVGGGFIDGDASQSLVTKYMNPSDATATNTTYVDKLYVSGTSIDFLKGEGQVGGTNPSFTRNSIARGGGLVFGQNNQWIESGNSVLLGGEGNRLIGSTQSAIVSGNINDINYGYSTTIVGGYDNTVNNQASRWNTILGGAFNIVTGNAGDKQILGGYYNRLENSSALHTAIISGEYNLITSNSGYGTIINGDNNTISGHTRATIIGGSGLTSNYDNEVQVPNLTIANYASLNYADDTAAAAGGIFLGQVYHNNGALRIRIT